MKPKTIPNFFASLFAQLLPKLQQYQLKARLRSLFYQSYTLQGTKQNVCERQKP